MFTFWLQHTGLIFTFGGQHAGLTDRQKMSLQGLYLLSVGQHLRLKILHQSLEISVTLQNN
jgi:hypothetical protein